jgi:DNA-binding YbaB/EbfC family protein
VTDLNEIMKQAKKMQEQFQDAQEELKNIEVFGEAGGGLVKISMTGRHDVSSVLLDRSLLAEDKEIIEDLIAAAVNDAVRKLEAKNKEAMGGMAGNFKMPSGFKFPF